MSEQKKVVIVDQEPVFRSGLKGLLQQRGHCLVVGEAADSEGLEAFCKKHKPHLVMLELPSDEFGSLGVITSLREALSGLSVLCHSGHRDYSSFAVRVMRLGAQGYLNKRQPIEDFLQAFDVAISGQRYISTDVAQYLADALYDPDARPGHEGLSDREFQTMLMLASGMSVTDIATKEGLSVKTVSEYRARVLRKLGLKHTIELIQYAFRRNLVS